MPLETIQVSPAVYRTVINWAKADDITPNQVIERLLVWQSTHSPKPVEATLEVRYRKVRQELQAFEQQRPSLLKEYQGQYIAMHQGQVIDHDVDLRVLHQRVFARLKHTPVLLKRVTAEPERELVFRSPRFERSEA